MDNLAREAFAAQSFTGYEPTGFPPKPIEDNGCALDENQEPSRETVKFVRYSFGEGDYTTTQSPPISADEDASGNVIIYMPPLPFHSAQSGKGTKAALIDIIGQLTRTLRAYEAQLPADTYATIQRRLPVILDPEEWDPDEALPDASSFEAMLRFLVTHAELQPPRIVLSRKGFFMVSWRAARDQLTTLEFYPDGMIRWLVFAPPASGEQTKQRAAGDSSAKKVLAHIAPYGTANWMKRDSR